MYLSYRQQLTLQAFRTNELLNRFGSAKRKAKINTEYRALKKAWTKLFFVLRTR